MRTKGSLLARLAALCVALITSAMSKSKTVTIYADKINYVHFTKEETGTKTTLKKAFIDMYIDGIRSRVEVKIKEICMAG